MVREKKGVEFFSTRKERTFAIKRLKKEGYNYFVTYSHKDQFALQSSKSNSAWVKSRSKDGIFISGF